MIHRAFNRLLTLSVLLLAQHSHAEVPSDERQRQLLNLLAQDCGSCHGMTLQGGLGPALLPGNLSGKPDALLVETILNGRSGTAMPPWKSFLTQDEAVWLVGHLKQGPGSAGPSTPP